LRNNIPDFQPGDYGAGSRPDQGIGNEKSVLQAFEGALYCTPSTVVRAKPLPFAKTSFGVGVERIFPLHATIIDHIDVVKKGHVRRAKLYYLRNLRGKGGAYSRARHAPERKTSPGPPLSAAAVELPKARNKRQNACG
jgi:large subunit ribosomal protein L19